MKKGDVFEEYITDFDFPNKGSLELEDRKVVVKDSLPGQKVRFSICKKKTGIAEGRLLEVVERAEIENVKPECEFFGMCGGCSYQRLSYDNQLKFKEQLVKKIIDKALPDYEYIWEGISASPDFWEYRNKMEFTFGDEFKDGPLALGMHKKGNFHDIVNVCGEGKKQEDYFDGFEKSAKTGCLIINKEWRSIVSFTLNFFKEKQVPYYHRMKHEGILRNLVIRQSKASGEFLINLVTSTQWKIYGFDENIILKEYVAGLIDLEKVQAFEGKIAGVLYTENDVLGDVVKSDRTEILYGRDYITEEILGLKFKISPYSFFQTNTKGCEVLYSKAREYVNSDKSKVVFDLYSGTGTIAQMMAGVSKKVIGIEIVEEAVIAARENAKLNSLDNCEFIAGDVLKAIDMVDEKPDLIIVDPPRDGINPKALDKILNFGVDQIIYISCKPTSLARDLKIITERGYKLEKACCVDQFPQTANVECIVCIQKIKDRKD